MGGSTNPEAQLTLPSRPIGTSTKSAEWLTWRAEKSCQFICADYRHTVSPFDLHPVLSAVSIPFRDLQQQIGQ